MHQRWLLELSSCSKICALAICQPCYILVVVIDKPVDSLLLLTILECINYAGKRLLSLYTEVSDSNDSEEEEVDSPAAKASDNEEYDSDKDPAWSPVEQVPVSTTKFLQCN